MGCSKNCNHVRGPAAHGCDHVLARCFTASSRHSCLLHGCQCYTQVLHSGVCHHQLRPALLLEGGHWVVTTIHWVGHFRFNRGLLNNRRAVEVLQLPKVCCIPCCLESAYQRILSAHMHLFRFIALPHRRSGTPTTTLPASSCTIPQERKRVSSDISVQTAAPHIVQRQNIQRVVRESASKRFLSQHVDQASL